MLKRPYEGGYFFGGVTNTGLPDGYVVYQVASEKNMQSIAYEGMFKDGEEHGPGKIIWSDGSTYEGHFEKGKPVGRGILRDSNGLIVYTGHYDFQLGFHGWGTQYLAYGAYYEGQFARGLKNGHGLMKFANNDFYFGNWHNNVKEGTGTYQFAATGDTISGEWVNDENETFNIIKKASENEEDIDYLHDTINAMALSLDRWQSACDLLQEEAKRAGVDPAVMKIIIDKAVFVE